MVSLMLLVCYLPMGLLPAVLPARIVRRLAGFYPTFALLPPVALLVTIMLAQPLTSWLGYGVVFLPLGLSLVSLAAAVVGIRLTLHARRKGQHYGWLLLASFAAGLPFLATSPFVVIGFQSLARLLGPTRYPSDPS